MLLFFLPDPFILTDMPYIWTHTYFLNSSSVSWNLNVRFPFFFLDFEYSCVCQKSSMLRAQLYGATKDPKSDNGDIGFSLFVQKYWFWIYVFLTLIPPIGIMRTNASQSKSLYCHRQQHEAPLSIYLLLSGIMLRVVGHVHVCVFSV